MAPAQKLGRNLLCPGGKRGKKEGKRGKRGGKKKGAPRYCFVLVPFVFHLKLADTSP